MRVWWAMAFERRSDDYDHRLLFEHTLFLGFLYFFVLPVSEGRLHDSNDARIARIRILFRKLRNIVIVPTDLHLAPSVGQMCLVVYDFQVRVRGAHQPAS